MSGSRMAPSSERMRALLAEQAAEWVVRLQDPAADVTDRAEFAAWVRGSPERVLEFLNAKATWEAFGGEALKGLPVRDELVQLAKSAAGEVVALESEPVALTPTLSRKREREPSSSPSPLRGEGRGEGLRERIPTRRALAAALAVITIGGLVLGGQWVAGRFGNHAIFTTGIGEQETYTLRDGSSVALNTRTRVRLNWSDQYRDVYLESGEALFQVEKDPARPFRVWSGTSMVRAVGTRFNVYRADDAVIVTVLEGRVEVTPVAEQIAAPFPALALTAGDQTRIDKETPPSARRLERPERSIAWQERRLEFEAAPLSEVIAEFNRYHEIPLVLDDPGLGAKRINGSFDAADRDSLVGFLETFENVAIEARADGLIVRAR